MNVKLIAQSPYNQSGIALLQILLLAAVMSLLAMRFTLTARDQIEISRQFEDRVNAHLTAHSVVNEVIFLRLSHLIEQRTLDTKEFHPLPSSDLISTAHGDAVEWRPGVVVELQDLNGLLPQIFPQHPLWRRLLLRKRRKNAKQSRRI